MHCARGPVPVGAGSCDDISGYGAQQTSIMSRHTGSYIPTIQTGQRRTDIPNAVITDAIKRNQIEIDSDRVRKQFFGGPGRALRFRREVEALRRLSVLDEVPMLISYSPDRFWLITERIPGVPLDQAAVIPDGLFNHLSSLIDRMLRCGVARHSLPARDVIVRPDGHAGLVDFERCTLRRWRWSPIWWIACKVTRFNLLRLIHDCAPHLLTPGERRRLHRQYQLRKGFHVVRHGLRFCTRWCRRLLSR